MAPQIIARDEIAHGEHVRAETQLKVDRRGETAFAAAGADCGGRREVRSHRLLDQSGGRRLEALARIDRT